MIKRKILTLLVVTRQLQISEDHARQLEDKMHLKTSLTFDQRTGCTRNPDLNGGVQVLCNKYAHRYYVLSDEESVPVQIKGLLII